MEISSINNALILYKRIFSANTATKPVIEFSDKKPDFVYSEVCNPFSRVTPESQGVSSAHLYNFYKELAEDKTLNMHNIMVLKNGKVISEVTFGNSDLSVWKMSFSACKSVVSLAIGMLVDEGKLDINTPILEFFPEYSNAVLKVRLREITVKTLLTMSSGSSFNEFICMASDNWERSFLKSNFSLRPGTTFNYNSLNTYMLSSIVKRVSGVGLSEYLENKLFGPLGIYNYHFEKSPTEIEKGGWGLYILPEDFAKIGQLVLQNGVWDGKQIISENWIKDSTAKQITTPEFCGDFDYGYQIWTGENSNSFLFNGMFGQNVWGFKDSGVLIVSNAGNNELFQQSTYYKIVNKYFSVDFPKILPESIRENKTLINYTKSLSNRQKNGGFLQKLTMLWRESSFNIKSDIIGKEFGIVSENAATVGLLPKFLQIIRCNYSSGFKSVKFMYVDDILNMVYCENDSVFNVKLGVGDFITTEIDYYGEKYLVASSVNFGTDEDGDKVITVICDFLETFSSRKIKIYFKKGKVIYRQFEAPFDDLSKEELDKIKAGVGKNKLLSAVLGKIDEDYISYKLQSVFEPQIRLIEI